MMKKILQHKLWIALLVCSVSLLPLSEALARDRRGRRETIHVDNRRYHYYGGRFYQPSWFGFDIALRIPSIGTVISTLPFGYRTVVVGGDTYYNYDNIYYRSYPNKGYVVVQQPTVVTQFEYNTVVVNVPDTNGGYTAVTLMRHGDGYVGPQGEYYPGNPTVEQLKALYGR